MSSLSKPPSLNKLHLTGPVWLASDIHLSQDSPATAEAFYTFLDRAPHEAQALFILGDLFDVWVGDDAISHPALWLKQALDALAQCAQRMPLYVGLGNRDFLLGDVFLKRIGAHRLTDQTLLTVGDTTTLISHGDEYCTHDHSYQRFKWWVRQPWVQLVFKSLSLSRRLSIAAQVRAKSIHKMAQLPSSLQNKGPDIIDVSADAIVETFQRFHISSMIHGHTHRPGHHPYVVGEQISTRWVLPDWEYDHLPNHIHPRGGYIAITNEGVELVCNVSP